MKRDFLPAFSLAALLCGFASAHADVVEPRVLSAEDVRLYREIFAAEREGRFADAKEDVTKLSDSSLVGYAVAEHLLSPHGKRTPVTELAAWLDEYNDLPIADRIRALAEKRNKHHRVEIIAPEYIKKRGGGYEDNDLNEPLVSDQARAAQPQIEADIKAGQPAQAETVLQTLQGGTVEEADVARLTHRVAASYLAEAMDADAYRVSTAVTRTDFALAPLLDWDAGISAYKLGKYQEASQYFESLAQMGAVPNFIRAQGAFWAARAYIQAGEPLRVVSLLTAAAREEPTFYGLLAERMLGQDSQTGFSDPVLDRDSFESLMRIPAAHRAVALYQIGETAPIGAEMVRALAVIDLNQQGQAFAALARDFDEPNLELRASETQVTRGTMLTGLFPVPKYQPDGGYIVDRSLVLAFIRAESKFQANALSYAGARGIMQIMPGTAQRVNGTMPTSEQMNDPTYNMALGQRILRILLDQVNGNLVQLAAAYNAGEGNVTRWVGTRQNQMGDPLLFIESIPASQTRTYVKEVLMYYWMYARRTGESAPTLDQTASGKWPIYKSYIPNTPVASTPQPPQISTMLVSDASTPH